MVHGDRVALQPGLHLLGGPVGAGIGPAVAPLPVGQGLDEGGALGGPGPGERVGRRHVHRVGVVAVDDDRVEPVGRGPARGGVGRRGDLGDGGVLHVQVVLADEHRRQVPHLGEVEGLVECADVGGAVAEERHRRLLGAAVLGGPGRAVGHAQVGADDGVAAHHSVVDAGEVHRPALARHQAVGPSQQLGHHRPHGRSPGQGVGVAPVGGEGPVVGPHGRPEPGGHRLLADGEVAGPLHQALEEQAVDPLLEQPHLLQQAVEPQAHVEMDGQLGVGVVHRGREDGRLAAVLLVGDHRGHGRERYSPMRVG